MRSGLYAIVTLDGAPIGERERNVLGFSIPPKQHERQADGFAVQAQDREEGGRAVHLLTRDDGVVALLGHLDEPAELAGALGMPPQTPPAELALAALQRFGDEAPLAMLGEWSLLRWHAPSRALTVMMSDACRDPIYFATDGKHVAVSPEIRRLAKLDWVGAAFDPQGLALQLSRQRLRRIMTNETALRGVTRVVPGTCEIFGPLRRTSKLPPQPQPAPWKGSFEDAAAEVEEILRRIVRQHLGRHGNAASLLSGGLDSSLLAWLESQERGRNQQIVLLTSVAPEDSNIPDERAFSKAVADRLGMPLTFVCPPPDASPYAPAARMLAHTELPVASPRHYLYDALYDAAFAHGATVLFDGVYGELTISNHLPLANRKSAIQHLRDARTWLRSWRGREAWGAGVFHARLSKDVLAVLPPEWHSQWRKPFDSDPWPRAEEPWGFRPAIRKNAMTPSSSPDARLRHLMPYRDRRLLRLVASMPGAFLHHESVNRALSRAIMKGRLPDNVHRRMTRGQFSPDYMQRLKSQAPGVLVRLEDFRAAGAGEWLDLEWLEAAVRRIGDDRAVWPHEPYDVQATAVAAEFFVWWNAQMRD